MRLLRCLIQVITALFLITSCDKPIEVAEDGTVISSGGFVQVDSTKYEMSQLIVEKGIVHPDHGGREYQIYLLDSGYVINLNQDQEIDSISGIGNYTTIWLTSADTLKIPVGEYPFNVINNKTQIFTTCESFFGVEFGKGDIFGEGSTYISGDNDGQLSIQNISSTSLTFGISGVCVTDSINDTPYQVYYSGVFHFDDLDE